MPDLTGKRIAILCTEGVEQSELVEPRAALDEAGALTEVVSPKDKFRTWKMSDWGFEYPADRGLDTANPADFDALVLPGGTMNPDKLRLEPKAAEFVRGFVENGKPVAAICHGPWMLVETGAVRGRTLTSWPSLRTDIRNAGGTWVDQEVVVDNGLVTSRKPDDLPGFNRKMIEEFAEGEHKRKVA
jgi:protease I